MNLVFGNHSNQSRHHYFVINIGPKPESVESFLKKAFYGMGLRSSNTIKSFNLYLRKKYGIQNFYQDRLRDTKANVVLMQALQNPRGKILQVKVRISPKVIDHLKGFGINLRLTSSGKANVIGFLPFFKCNVNSYQRPKKNFIPKPKKPITQWTTNDKLQEVIQRTAALLPEEVGKQLLALLEPTALAIMATVVVVWAVSHFFGVGEIADVILLIVGIVSMGPIAFTAGEHLINFAYKTVYAKSEEDLDLAAENLSKAISLIGIQTVMMLLLKKAPKVLKEDPNFSTFRVRDLPPNKRPNGKWFYKPKISTSTYLGKNVLGATYKYGDIKYLSILTGKTKKATILHEKVHSWLTPKLYLFRNYRVTLNWNSYAKSYLLRYLEEALAQTIGQVGAYGFKRVFSGVTFPVKNGYVTIQHGH